MTKNKIFVLIFVLGLLVFMTMLLRSPAAKMKSPAMITSEKLATLKEAVLAYADENQVLPEKLSDLKLSEDCFVDPGGTPFIYEVKGNRVTILSYGSDGKPGGHTFRSDKKTSFQWP